MDFNAIAIAAFVGTLLTVFFAYFPRVRVWFASLAVEKASLLKLGLMVVIAGVMFGLSYTNLFPPPLTPESFLGVVLALIMTNQPVAALLPAPFDVRMAIRTRVSKFLR